MEYDTPVSKYELFRLGGAFCGIFNEQKREFYSKWKDDHNLEHYDSNENLIFCIPCRKYEKKRGRFVILTGTNNFPVDAIKQQVKQVSYFN